MPKAEIPPFTPAGREARYREMGSRIFHTGKEQRMPFFEGTPFLWCQKDHHICFLGGPLKQTPTWRDFLILIHTEGQFGYWLGRRPTPPSNFLIDGRDPDNGGRKDEQAIPRDSNMLLYALCTLGLWAANCASGQERCESACS